MLSVVFTLRNDDHGGQMIQRANAFLESLHHLASMWKLAVEPILVEWNPPMLRPSLSKALDWPPSSELFKPRCLIVSRKYHRTQQNHRQFPLFQFIAKNVGIRRATGDFILATNPDVIISDELGFSITQAMDARCVYRAIRADLDSVPPKGLARDTLREFCRTNVVKRHKGKCWGMHTHACGDFTMMHRSAWFKMAGYAEFRLWSIHIDSLGLAQAVRAGGLHEQVLDGDLYHSPHKASWATDPHYGDNLPKLSLKQAARLVEGMYPDMRINDADLWGLSREKVGEVEIGC